VPGRPAQALKVQTRRGQVPQLAAEHTKNPGTGFAVPAARGAGAVQAVGRGLETEECERRRGGACGPPSVERGKRNVEKGMWRDSKSVESHTRVPTTVASSSTAYSTTTRERFFSKPFSVN
jgi:hypothetical protein